MHAVEPVAVTDRAGTALTLRRLNAADLDAVLAIERRAHSHPTAASTLQSLLGRHTCWGLEHSGQLVGFALIAQVVDESELLNIAIDPAWQGRGWGELLLELAIARLAPAIRGMFLEVRASNAGAIALYEKRGFAEVGLRRNYYPAAKGSEDAILMALDLTVYE
jgi:ribosomal-protein-alanine N-acetyltransferase